MNFIVGSTGSGKTTHVLSLINGKLKEGKKCLLINDEDSLTKLDCLDSNAWDKDLLKVVMLNSDFVINYNKEINDEIEDDIDCVFIDIMTIDKNSILKIMKDSFKFKEAYMTIQVDMCKDSIILIDDGYLEEDRVNEINFVNNSDGVMNVYKTELVEGHLKGLYGFLN